MTRLASIGLFWAILLVLVALDQTHFDKPRAEPPAILMGSGIAASGGHCSGR
ncbi:MAG: hypothetical protein RLZZ344_561 [Pseudomonadota bacterium]|jgi:hypothetical protein